MAKIDEQVKKELEKRSIAPSAGSWAQLSSQLEAQDKKKGNYKWYLGIAASFLAGILIASFFGNGNETEVNVVNAEEKTVPKSVIEKQENIFATEIEGELVYDTQLLKEVIGDLPEDTVEESTSQPKFALENKKTNLHKNQRIAKARTKPSTSAKSEKQRSLIALKTAEEEKTESGMTENQAALLAQVEGEEIDALLENARYRVRLRHFSNPYARVSAEELLQNIEVEDKESFKEKVFLALESGFQHVKSSVIK